MSIYPLHSTYGQPSYSQYVQPISHSGFYHQQHQPPVVHPPVYHLDPATFRREYSGRLTELTFNSRPIIQSLSMLAQEYSRFADIVAQSLEAHIRRVPPWLKLPAFYLLDAISKNVYEPYARHFSGFVLPLFLDTYNGVDEITRNKMEEMLLTWRTGSPSGKELFGVPPQVAIERGVWGDAAIGNGVGQSGSSHITRTQVLCELDFIFNQKKHALLNNSYDAVSQNHITVLSQLRKLVEVGVSQEELQQILGQLRNLVKNSPVPTHSQSWTANASPLPPPPSVASSSSGYLVPTTQSCPTTNNLPASKTDQTGLELAGLNTSPSIISHVPDTQTPATIANLLSTLLKAGVVSASSTPSVHASNEEECVSKSKDSENVVFEREGLRAYRQIILSQPIKLNGSDILRARPQIVEMLYNQLTAQCKQCGIRFSDTVTGKKSMGDHLDMHFRQNRKANQNIGRGHSRSWFIGLDDWIRDTSTLAKGKSRSDSSSNQSTEAAKLDAELRTRFVVVPPGDEAKTILCSICQEILKSEFLDEDEEWVWKNAMKKDDRVFHATCHAEAINSTSSLAARLRMTTGRSRSGTPEASLTSSLISASRVTPPAKLRDSKSPLRVSSVGMKRKLDEVESSTVNGELDRTLPVKKSAMAS